MSKDLKVGQVAQIAGCSPSTVRRWAEKGFLEPSRNYVNWRMFPIEQAYKLRELLTVRG